MRGAVAAARRGKRSDARVGGDEDGGGGCDDGDDGGERDVRVLLLGSCAGLLGLLALRAGATHVTCVERWVGGEEGEEGSRPCRDRIADATPTEMKHRAAGGTATSMRRCTLAIPHSTNPRSPDVDPPLPVRVRVATKASTHS